VPVTVSGEEVFDAGTDPWLRAKRFVSVGGPIDGHEARIDPCAASEHHLDLPPQIGELKIRGPSVTSGYLRRPKETAELLDADGWFSTRDLAFRHQGRYYICGRLKEIIIVRGENYFPEDFEQLVDRLRPLTPFPIVGRAAFPRAGKEGEEVALAVEVKGMAEEADLQRFLEALRAASSERFGLDPVVIFLPPRSIPRTTSGKLQRLLLARRLESGELLSLDLPNAETS
jgi:acyl-CoA synthetase (AMP-forming)/AMP-acid ligase II